MRRISCPRLAAVLLAPGLVVGAAAGDAPFCVFCS